ncbi:hypothetical protein [Pseudoflavonifractor phocaeensis]|uniref:hypothetical protein n=1 Tax=Pseudoflavonifractor phocaeensis TaxID=1870988 RepID=UPI001F2B8861|nr:hypothetical protein [Pseudoflavonifractor phocaeensis]MCF2662699.1 hypothetical protein [Pseudoflavonifractor phocaeensis]
MKKAYVIDYTNSTITVNSSFYEKMQDPTSEEYKLIKAIRADYPEMRIVNRTHKTPTKYVSKSTGETFNCNQFKNLTYKNMRGFIEALPNKQDYLPAYEFLEKCASLPQTSRYTVVRKWFVAQFPEFRKNPLFYLYNEVKVVDITPFIEEEQTRAEEKQAS